MQGMVRAPSAWNYIQVLVPRGFSWPILFQIQRIVWLKTKMAWVCAGCRRTALRHCQGNGDTELCSSWAHCGSELSRCVPICLLQGRFCASQLCARAGCLGYGAGRLWAGKYPQGREVSLGWDVAPLGLIQRGDEELSQDGVGLWGQFVWRVHLEHGRGVAEDMGTPTSQRMGPSPLLSKKSVSRVFIFPRVPGKLLRVPRFPERMGMSACTALLATPRSGREGWEAFVFTLLVSLRPGICRNVGRH